MYDSRKQVIPTIPYACVKPALICLPGSSRGFQLDPLDLHHGVTRDPLERSKGVHHVPPSEGVRGCSPHPLRFLHLWNADVESSCIQIFAHLLCARDMMTYPRRGSFTKHDVDFLRNGSSISGLFVTKKHPKTPFFRSRLRGSRLTF